MTNPINRNEITITDANGTVHRGWYTINSRIMTVTYGEAFRKTQVGNTPPESLAKMLLSELVREGES